MSGILSIRFVQVLLLAAAQVLVCNQIHLFGYASPMLATLLFCYIPKGSNHIVNMLWAFLLGLIIDIFTGTPGENAASLTFCAFVQWYLLRAMLDKDAADIEVASYRRLGITKHVFYIMLLSALHHILFYALEAFSIYHLTDTLIAMGSSYVLSTTIMISVDSMRDRKKKA